MVKNDFSVTLWTIGHSSVGTDRLFELLRRQRIELLVDVRAVPYSRYVPQANRDVLEAAAKAAGLTYLFMGDSLGGKPREDQACGPEGKPDYARMAQADSFLRGIDRLIELTETRRVCIMCSNDEPIDYDRR